MTTLLVTYPGDGATRFDRDYYVGIHLPLVRDAWGPHGLESIAAYFPADERAEVIAIAVCRFLDEAALRAALRSARTPEVMADVGRFTDALPTQSRMAPL